MDPNFVQGLHNLLVQSTSSDTNLLKTATVQLNQDYYTNPACISALATILASSSEQHIRQLAAVELRKRIYSKKGDFWTQLPQSDRQEIKGKLPEIIVADNLKSSNLVRHSTARVIAAIASIELPLGQWPELLPIVHQTCGSQNPEHREAGSYILYTILENVDTTLSANFSEVLGMIVQLLADPASLEVRANAVKCLGILSSWLSLDEKPQIKSIQAAVPSMLQVLGQAVEAQDEANCRQLFDVLESLLILEVPVLSKAIPQLVEFLVAKGGDRSIEIAIRVLILNALQWTVSYKKSKVQGQNLAPSILEHLMPITAEDTPEDPDDEAPSRSALRIVDTLSTKLPPTQVFPTLRQLIVQYFSSADPAHRRGGMLALGVAVEGCSEYMTPLMDQVWPMISAGLNDSDVSVRKATCSTISCLCEWLDDQVAAKHEILLPALMNLINDPATQKSACTALDSLLEIMHDNIGQYLNLIMERLVGLLETAPMPVKSIVTGAIGSAAHASKEQFLPYFQPTMDRLKHFLLLTGEGEEAELRGLTMDAIGTFAEAVGKEVFRPYVTDMMQQAIAGLESGNSRMRECSFLFFNVTARLFESEFSPYLPTVVPALIASCKQDEGGDSSLEISVADATTAFASGSDPSNAIKVSEEGGASMSGNDDGEDLDLDKFLEVNNAIAIEKEIATDAIGVIFAATGRDFEPYMESATMALIDLLPHYYEGIRKQAVEALLEIVRTFYGLQNYPEWTAGIAVQYPLDGPMKTLVNHILPAILEMYETEDDKSVASAMCVSLAETIQVVGPAILEGKLETLCNIAIQILEQKAFCQQDPDQDDEEGAPEEQAEEESVLISAAEDLVSGIANALGEDFGRAFQTFFPLISNFYKTSRSLSDRSSSIGCLSEIISGMKSAVSPFTEPLLELFYRALSDEGGEVASNAAFATGLLIEHSDRDLSAQFPQLLLALHRLFNVTTETPPAMLNARDNAAGAVGRMIVKNTAAVPLDEVLPIIVPLLPLQHDSLENTAVFRAIVHLYQTNPAAISGYTAQLLPVWGQVLDPAIGEKYASTEVRGQIIQLLSLLNAENPAIIQAAGLSSYVS